ncbi:phage N-6-adenine-methyltransferase [Halobaculum sp. CBA1158]|uniref:phage N-6-adenine-methyltransferase n=1 Tax=Halobaculum sp. CBA1158 TaxID=2904243 RepID=UPI001F2B621B|nr:phage N-6-adenine-methyltransferase [Halobaculum sp. CBA1158]UIO98880.1 phage N-6-adenine-methyltransferase [Halobaculum sp. CBA1158]
MSDPSVDETDNEKDLHHGPMMQAEQDPSNNEYGTPSELWRRLAQPVDGFDVDPCSGAEATPIAPTRYTEEDDGLRQAWHGDVFVNPPWSSNGDASAKEQWLSKCRAEANRDAVDSVVVLLPSDTSAGWFHEHVLAAEIVCFYGPGRLSFDGGGKNPSFGILIPVYGDDAEAYRDVLDSIGTVIDGRGVYQPTIQTGLVAAAQRGDSA